jgi:hypothetical protein
MPELYRNALALGGATVVIAVGAQFPRLRPFLPFLALAACGLGFGLEVLDRAWAFASLRSDAPWLVAVVLAAWSVHGGSAWLRARSWWAVVAAAAVFGDLFVAAGLAVVEPDPRRRARLVVAASGASLLGRTSGAGALVLGWGGVEVVALGIACALVGFVRGGVVDRAPLRPAWSAMVPPLVAAVATWLVAAGGSLEVVAVGLEQAPIEFPRVWEALVAGAAALAGVLGDEGTFALIARGMLERALSLRGDQMRQLLLAGLGVGGGLPLLLYTRSSLKVGLPLWLVQVAMLLGWSLRP